MITPEDFRLALQLTLEDQRLTRSEKRALGHVLDGVELNEQQAGVYRSIAFDVARQACIDADSKAVLEWLEDVMKVLQSAGPSAEQLPTAETYFTPGDNCPRKIAHLLAGTRTSVDICVFTITDDRISQPIIDAHRRGINVRIVTDDEKAFDAGSDIDDLVRAGVPVRVDRTSYHMHHKFAIFDRKLVLTGSYNWTRGAAEYNEENFIVSEDARFVRSFSDVFSTLWDKFA